jgi:peroxiredoxin
MSSSIYVPQVGEPAPDVELRDESGSPVKLSDFWRNGAVALIFIRHFG